MVLGRPVAGGLAWPPNGVTDDGTLDVLRATGAQVVVLLVGRAAAHAARALHPEQRGRPRHRRLPAAGRGVRPGGVSARHPPRAHDEDPRRRPGGAPAAGARRDRAHHAAAARGRRARSSSRRRCAGRPMRCRAASSSPRSPTRPGPGPTGSTPSSWAARAACRASAPTTRPRRARPSSAAPTSPRSRARASRWPACAPWHPTSPAPARPAPRATSRRSRAPSPRPGATTAPAGGGWSRS